MRIGVDASCWANGRGYGRFTREVMRHLPTFGPADEFVCFLDPWAAEQFDVKRGNVRVVRVTQGVAPTQAASAGGHRSLHDMLRFTRAVMKEQLDVFFSPTVYTYFPLPPRLPAVVTVHDAIAERFPRLTLPRSRDRWFWRSKVKFAIWQSRLVLTVSDYAARELVAVHRIPRTRLRVATEAPSAAYRPSESAEAITAMAERIGLPPNARWFVYVGGFNPHKRVDLLVRAHAALAVEQGDQAPYLVLVGAADRDSFHKDIDSIRAVIAAAGTERLVRWTGFLPDDELRHVHSGALALVLPSESEGFGLPAVEAAACGAPVIATTESPLPRLLAGGGIFVRPGDAEELAVALQRIACDEPARQIMAARARERAGELTWARSARAVLAAVHEAGNRGEPLINGRQPLGRLEAAR